jgi:hypothetical protein
LRSSPPFNTVGDRQGGEHPCAANDDPVGGLAHDPEGDERVVELAHRLGTIDLRVGQRVGQGEIVVADVEEVGEGVGPEARVALREVLGRHAGRHDVDVEVVRCAAHEDERGVGPHLVHRRPAGEIPLRRGDDEAHADALAGRGLHVGHHVDEVGTVLQVVQGCQRLGDVGGARVRSRIDDLLALDPQAGGSFLQASEDLVTGSCSHGWGVSRITSVAGNRRRSGEQGDPVMRGIR